MRSRQTGEIEGIGAGMGTDQLGFFTAHDIGHVRLVPGNPCNEADIAAIAVQAYGVIGDLRKARGHGKTGRFTPADTGTGRAADQHGQ